MVYGSSIDMFVARLGVHFVKRQLEAIPGSNGTFSSSSLNSPLKNHMRVSRARLDANAFEIRRVFASY